MTFKYELLQQTMASLHISDQELLRQAGLSPLAKVYDAYPASQGSTKLCVLLPNGLKPQMASRFPEAQAISSKIVVLQQDMNKKKWTKIWPVNEPETNETCDGEIVEE